jgi:phage terminase large subunit-like protein
VAYEDALHLTGAYPGWWEGRRFDRPIVCWACGTDAKAVREKLQPVLVGPTGAQGTGMIPRANLLRAVLRSGTPDAIDFALVQHASGGISRLVFKAFEQGRESFQSAEVDVIQLDEEPPMDIYTEALTRTISTVPGRRNGCVLFSFTPLRGLSDVVLQFLPGGAYPSTLELRKQAWGW